MVAVAQLVRAPGCGPGGRGSESRLLPIEKNTDVSVFFNTKQLSQLGLFLLIS